MYQPVSDLPMVKSKAVTAAPIATSRQCAFGEVAKSFGNPGWPKLTLQTYRARLEGAELGSRKGTRPPAGGGQDHHSANSDVHGGDDRVVFPKSSSGLDEHFTAPYHRVLLNGVGHFPTREWQAVGALSPATVQLTGHAGT